MRSHDIYSTDVARGWLPWGALAPFLGFAFVVGSVLAGTALITPYFRLDARGNPVDPVALTAFTIVPFGLLAVVVLAWVRFVERRPLQSIGLGVDHRLRTFLGGHGIGMASIIAIVVVIWMAGGLSATGHGAAWLDPSALGSILLLLAGFALQSSVEELLFRGWLLSVLARKFNVVVAVILSSALFALLHYSRGAHWLVTLGTLLFGVFACSWALRTRSILGVMGWHSGWNWLLAVGFGLPLTGLDVGIPALLVDLRVAGPGWLTGGEQGPEASVVCCAYFVLSIAWLLFWPRRAPAA